MSEDNENIFINVKWRQRGNREMFIQSLEHCLRLYGVASIPGLEDPESIRIRLLERGLDSEYTPMFVSPPMKMVWDQDWPIELASQQKRQTGYYFKIKEK